MSLKKEITVTSFDVMPDSVIKPSALFRYFQQTAREHLDSLGLTFDVMKKNNCVFVLTRMKTRIYESIKGYDEICVATSSRKIKGAVFIRDFKVTKDSLLVAEASTQWAIIDLEKRILRRPSVYADYFPETEELCSFDSIEKCAFGTEFENHYDYKVTFSDIDENYHMNNTRYSDICLDAIDGIEEGKTMEEVLIEFNSEARLSDRLCVGWEKRDNAYMFSAQNENTQKHCFNAVIKIR